VIVLTCVIVVFFVVNRVTRTRNAGISRPRRPLFRVYKRHGLVFTLSCDRRLDKCVDHVTIVLGTGLVCAVFEFAELYIVAVDAYNFSRSLCDVKEFNRIGTCHLIYRSKMVIV
jgi:hypothetical protein